MIFDCFIFNNEFDILDIRLHELNDVVDWFVILEGDTTFQGNPKPLYFQENRHLYREFEEKIIHYSETPEGSDPWEREAFSRDMAAKALKDLPNPDDIIMMSDADEIPRASVVKTLDPQEITMLNMDEYYYSLNLWTDYYGFTRACYWKDFPGGQALRRHWHEDIATVENAGWHFTYLMTPEQIAAKLEAFSHHEYNSGFWKDPKRLAARMRDRQDLFDRDTLKPERRYFDDHPRYVLDNLDRFGKFIK